MQKRVYIAGPMSGLPNENRVAFNMAAAVQSQMGNIPLNPAVLPDGLSQADYMRICMPMMQCADQLYVLDGYENSKGALAEIALAQKLDLRIVYQEGIDLEEMLTGLNG